MNEHNILITGASGGIGRAIVQQLAQPNHRLFLQANRHFEELQRFSEKLRDQGTIIDPIAANLESYADQDYLIRFVKEKLTTSHQLTGIVLAAGVDLMSQAIKPLSFESKLEKIWKTDVLATVRLARELGFWIKESKSLFQERQTRPTFLFFGWDGVERGMEGETAQLYSLAKGAIVAFAKSFAQEMAQAARVLTISPGWIQTTWGQKASPAANQRALSESLAKRWGSPEEIASIVRFLLSDDSSFLNSQNIIVNGGFNYRAEN
ncbi:MAG: SDR family oxidoreductase [Planctomycetia bacterium]|nr:SDR family oxidoreductase [Planctomycetia bacterium]